MKLVNQTAVSARIDLGQLEDTSVRYGMLTAKATFSVDERGGVELDRREPYPLYAKDEPHAFGVLPSDTLPRRDSVFEVIVLGAAVCSRPVREAWVALRIGARQRRLRVSGDRFWEAGPSGLTISAAQPFTRMDLTWQRAFGGACDVLLDADTPYELADGLNRYGKGFDADKLTADYAKALRAPPGYPKLIGFRRELPNIEDPERLVAQATDAPPPVCWATMPSDIGFMTKSAYDSMQAAGKPETMAQVLSRYYHRAHPDWVMALPAAGSGVELSGMTPDRPLAFQLPQLRVMADYELGPRQGVRELEPHLLVLLPDERRFYLVYRHFFTFQASPNELRSFRLRLAEGWFGTES